MPTMMKLSLFLLLLVLLGLSSATQQGIQKSSQLQKDSVLSPDLGNRIPNITANGSMLAPLTPSEFKKSQNLKSSLSLKSTNLQWQAWRGSLPSGAFSIYNGYAGRIDYVCKYKCEPGFYNPNLGRYCRYAYGGKEKLGSPFDILVNKDQFELLEWRDGSYGSVPRNSVYTCSGINVYVGKNEYGLGKVVPQHKAFFLPWKGKEYWYKHYQVLTFKTDISSEQISDVKYKTDGVKILQHPPETIGKSVITNNECQAVVKTVTLSKINQVENRWDTSVSLTIGVKSSITANIPLITSLGIEFSTETTKQFSKGTTVVESITHSVSVEQNVPPNHSCTVSMVGYKYKADIPYTARLKRTYSNGKTTWMSITGTYRSVQIGEVRSVVDRCDPVPNAKPCA